MNSKKEWIKKEILGQEDIWINIEYWVSTSINNH